MRNNLMKCVQKLIEVRGKKDIELKVFGVQIFLVTKTNPYHRNIYILFLPILRIETEKKKFAINVLICVWLYKFIKLMVTKWSTKKSMDKFEILFFNKTIISIERKTPFQFPTALYKG